MALYTQKHADVFAAIHERERAGVCTQRFIVKQFQPFPPQEVIAELVAAEFVKSSGGESVVLRTTTKGHEQARWWKDNGNRPPTVPADEDDDEPAPIQAPVLPPKELEPTPPDEPDDEDVVPTSTPDALEPPDESDKSADPSIGTGKVRDMSKRVPRTGRAQAER